VDARRYTLDPGSFEAAITPRTAAVIPVHLYGCPADMQAILRISRQHHLFVLEDGAQAHGARYESRRVGGLGDAAAFSFYPSKNLGAYGDAGAVTTGDVALAEKVQMLRHGGQRRTYEHEVVGVNSRLDEIQAAILRTKLVHLDQWNKRRQSLAADYDAALSDCEAVTLPLQPPDAEHVFHLYALRTHRRDDLQRHLAAVGVQTGVHYPRPVHLQPAYAHLGYKAGSCPNAEAAVGELLSLPLFPQLECGEQDQVIRGIRSFFGQHE
jgi:dTDP-4-amino-4,6-dideoxygalactose transaminase